MSTNRPLSLSTSRRSFLLGVTAFAGVTCCATQPTTRNAQPLRKPNVLLILADDMGYSDLGCYGGEIPTPNLDQLAQDGLRFTHFYNTARCCPTRACLLTGVTPHEAGMGHMATLSTWGARHHINAWYSGDLRQDTCTLAELLKSANYRTAMSGKWHVTKYINPTHKDFPGKYNWPLQRGFDDYYGMLHGADSYFSPKNIVRNNDIIPPIPNDESYYTTEVFAQETIRQINEAARTPDQPLFLYLAFNAPHWPLHIREVELKPFAETYTDGYEPIRNARLAKMKSLGIVPSQTQLPPINQPWKAVKNKADAARRMAIYAAQIHVMDRMIGQTITALKETGRFDDTLIIFLSDNGACAEVLDRGKVKTPGGPNSFTAYFRNWAQVSNTPLRQYKSSTYEGGAATPCIIHWPQGIELQRRGTLISTPAHIYDIMPTLAELSGATYPKVRQGHTVQPMEGISILPYVLGQKVEAVERTFVWEHEGNRAIRRGHWKALSMRNKPWKLYDLSIDRNEATNLAKQHPERLKALIEHWKKEAIRTRIVPGAFIKSI